MQQAQSDPIVNKNVRREMLVILQEHAQEAMLDWARESLKPFNGVAQVNAEMRLLTFVVSILLVEGISESE
jgi:hypothetical protein